MLEICLLGGITIRLNGELITQFRSQTEIALLAYLAHSGKTHNREALADLLWEARSTKQSQSNLRTVLARLRKRVGDQLVVTRKTVSLLHSVHEQTDSVRLQAILAGSGSERSPIAMNLLAQGLALYGGEMMADFSLANAPRFNDWLAVEQEHLRQMVMNGYRRLAGWQEELGAFAAGAATAQKWVTWDPLDEMAQQQLMRLLAYDGRSEEALRVYEQCHQLLQEELAITPAPTTIALYKSIQNGSLRLPAIIPAPAHNIPRPLTPLFGRRKEIQSITNIILNPDYPLVSISGGGGMGKTSLALATARHLLAEEKHPFRDGIWFVALETIEKDSREKIEEEVAALIGQAMGLYFHGESELWSQLVGQLASKHVLLILDNIEQFLTVASDLIIDLLEAGGNIHLLVTSRTTLALGASVAFPLAGLQAPGQPSPDAANNESVRLFAERAARLPVSFRLDKHLAEVVAICQFVEGMPLGIELAAASLGRLMIDEILPALINNLQLLETTQRDVPPRQRTLQAVFDYTWRLLDAREQKALAQISVFRGGFTREAAETVLSDSASSIYNLQAHALLNRSETGRFKLHPLVRQFARDKLNGVDMIELREQALNRHTAYFASLMHSFEDDLQRGEGQEALRLIDAEQGNLRAAWQHAVRSEQWLNIAKCLDSSHYFFQRKGLFNEETALVDSAISTLQGLKNDEDALLIGLHSRLLTVRAQDHLRLAQFEEGLQIVDQACDLAQKLAAAGAPAGVRANIQGQARLVRAQILSIQHEHEAALGQYSKVVAMARRGNNQILEADAWIGIGGQIIWQADVGLAQEPLFNALDLCQTLLYKAGEMEALRLLGTMAFRQGSLAESAEYHKRSLELSRALGDLVEEAEELGSLGVILHQRGDLWGSQLYKKEALATFRRLNMRESEQWLLGELGNTAILLGDYSAAEKNLTEALNIAQELNDDFWQAWIKLRLGAMWDERGATEKALELIMESFAAAEKGDNPRFMAAVQTHWGNVLLSQHKWEEAEQKLVQAYELRLRAKQEEQALPPLAGLAYATYQQGILETAAAHAEQLWQTWQESPAWAERAELKLYWLLGMVWEGLEDGRASDVWTRADALLEERSQLIPDEVKRNLFLEKVHAQRATLEAS